MHLCVFNDRMNSSSESFFVYGIPFLMSFSYFLFIHRVGYKMPSPSEMYSLSKVYFDWRV